VNHYGVIYIERPRRRGSLVNPEGERTYNIRKEEIGDLPQGDYLETWIKIPNTSTMLEGGNLQER